MGVLNFFAVDAYLAWFCSSLMHDIVGIGSAPHIEFRIADKECRSKASLYSIDPIKWPHALLRHSIFQWALFRNRRGLYLTRALHGKGERGSLYQYSALAAYMEEYFLQPVIKSG